MFGGILIKECGENLRKNKMNIEKLKKQHEKVCNDYLSLIHI